MKNIQTIAFDADDTLWINEPHFQETEAKFCELMEDYLSHHHISQELYKTEMGNLALYGYGVKSFMLSMVETALRVSQGTINVQVIEKILKMGKELLDKPVELLDGVVDVLKALHGQYKLVVATKGDLLNQEMKLEKSKLGGYFHHIEIMSDKKESDYEKLLQHLDITHDSFLMVGNSIKSDVLPVLNIGGNAVHIPFHTTWAYEHIDHEVHHTNFYKAENITDLLSLLR